MLIRVQDWSINLQEHALVFNWLMSVQNTAKQSNSSCSLGLNLVLFKVKELGNFKKDIDRQVSIDMRENVDLIFLRIFNIHRPEALMV